MSAFRFAVAIVVVAALLAGCGSGQSSTQAAAPNPNPRPQLQAELQGWNSRSLVSLREANAANSAGEYTVSHQDLLFARHDVQEMERIRVELDALGAGR